MPPFGNTGFDPRALLALMSQGGGQGVQGPPQMGPNPGIGAVSQGQGQAQGQIPPEVLQRLMALFALQQQGRGPQGRTMGPGQGIPTPGARPNIFPGQGQGQGMPGQFPGQGFRQF